MLDRIRIATRKSPLAIWQADYVKRSLEARYPELVVDLVGMRTEGDRFLDTPLATIGGKGLFVKELEAALLDGRADIAVHSMKDVAVDIPRDLSIPVMLSREDPRDVLVANTYASLDALPAGALVGTSSLRRQSQLRAKRGDLKIAYIRGNIGTRLQRLDAGEYDALLLAAAGMKRLGLASRVSQYISPELVLPAVGQGVIGIQCRRQDHAVQRLIGPCNDRLTSVCVRAERAFNQRLDGGCQLPIAAYATHHDGQITITGLVGAVDGSKLICDVQQGDVHTATQLGRRLAERLLAQGADQILQQALP